MVKPNAIIPQLARLPGFGPLQGCFWFIMYTCWAEVYGLDEFAVKVIDNFLLELCNLRYFRELWDFWFFLWIMRFLTISLNYAIFDNCLVIFEIFDIFLQFCDFWHFFTFLRFLTFFLIFAIFDIFPAFLRFLTIFIFIFAIFDIFHFYFCDFWHFLTSYLEEIWIVRQVCGIKKFFIEPFLRFLTFSDRFWP